MEQEQQEASIISSTQEKSAEPEKTDAPAVTEAVAKPLKTEKPIKNEPTKASKKSAKNLYVPYVTPLILYNAIRYTAMFLFTIIAKVRLRGRYNVPSNGACIVVANHLSWLDVPMIPVYIHRKVVFMAKEELFYSKAGWLVRFLGAFPVKRGEGDRQALRTADEQLKAGNIVVIFPEGTRSKTHALAKAHSGMGMIALRSGVPVVPVAIWGSEKVFKNFGAPVTISYGEPITLKPKGQKIRREDIEEATELVMHKIAEMLPPEYRGVYAEEPVQ
ncbi:MAG TPA: lysophospholipid acyltransferase family protein [Ktedonobacteraceae bacterium]|nr:lysophospholipid acyltransferase family protein [Ktedonobacteraceae bacterium]